MKKIYYILLISILLYSCQDVILVDVNDGAEKYVVEAYINNIESPTVKLTKSVPVYYEGLPYGVSNALVTITDSETPPNSVALVESEDSIGFYIVPPDQEYIGKVGQKYKLKIEVAGIIISTSDSLTSVAPIDSTQIKVSEQFKDFDFLAIFIFSQEPIGLGNYYKWDVFVNDTLIHYASNIVVSSDEFLDGNYIDGVEIYQDFHDPDEPLDAKLQDGDVVYIKQMSISAKMYDFYYQMREQGGDATPMFSVLPANIKGNLTNSDNTEVLGFFTASAISVSKKIIVYKPDENL